MLCDEADAKVAAAAAFAEEGRHVQAGKLFREAKVAYSTACGQSSSEELPVMLFRWGDGLYEIASHSKVNWRCVCKYHFGFLASSTMSWGQTKCRQSQLQ